MEIKKRQSLHTQNNSVKRYPGRMEKWNRNVKCVLQNRVEYGWIWLTHFTRFCIYMQLDSSNRIAQLIRSVHFDYAFCRSLCLSLSIYVLLALEPGSSSDAGAGVGVGLGWSSIFPFHHRPNGIHSIGLPCYFHSFCVGCEHYVSLCFS